MRVKIFSYGMNGEGVAKIDGKISLVPYAMVDEDVNVEIVKAEKTISFCKLNAVLSPSPARVSPPCPYFYECGGCDLQHMKYLEQLKFKHDLVKNTIRKITTLDFPVRECVPSKLTYAYRNKLSFNYLNGVSGFFRTNSNNLVPITHCLLASERINEVLTLFNKFLADQDKANRSISQTIRHLVVREIDEQILIGVVAKEYVDIAPFFNYLPTTGCQYGLYLIINNRKDSVVISGKLSHIAGIKQIHVSHFNLNYDLDIESFNQTNIDIQDKIYEKLSKYISPKDTVLNGFSGQGLLTAILAKKAKKVYGIELNASAHATANKLKRTNHISNMYNLLGDFTRLYPKYKSANKLVLDPSKKGCGKILKQVENDEILYISCNPIALSKDLRMLLDRYTVVEIEPYDMFPNTKNVETLVHLKKKFKMLDN